MYVWSLITGRSRECQLPSSAHSKQLPLYKPGVDSLQDAFIKLRITANICGTSSVSSIGAFSFLKSIKKETMQFI